MSYTDYQNLLISKEQAEQFAKQYFGINARVKELPGEIDFNFKLTTSLGEHYVLKVSRPDADTDQLDFQIAIQQHLQRKSLPFQIPQVVAAPDGRFRIAVRDEQGQERWLRLQTWVAGRVLAQVNPPTDALIHQLGVCCGAMSRALQDFDHPAAHRVYTWDPSRTLDARMFEPHIQGREEQELADYFWNRFEQITLPKLSQVRKSINHNDANDYNVLISDDLKDPQVTGIIDFVDTLYTHTVNELAIACAYACMDKPDPLQTACLLVAGYHSIFPLQEMEVEVLYDLLIARLMISVGRSAWNKKQEPDNEYLQISERPAWDLLRKLRRIAPEEAQYHFRAACGWEACTKRPLFDEWLENHKDQLAQVIPLKGYRVSTLDLSVGSLELGNNSNFADIHAFDRRIRRLLEDENADFGIGGYLETRPVYSTDAYTVMGNHGPKWRTVHLGLDVWGPAGTPVFAPLDGTIHSFNNNANERDYGPALILEHQVSEQLTFYTLYGHLSIADMDAWEVGRKVQKGEPIATIGSPPENGNWPPHLHFQVILDLFGNRGDYPGVAFPEQADVWGSICPEPFAFFDIEIAGQVPLRSNEQLLEKRKRHLGYNLSLSYQRPLHMVRGYLQHLYDVNGRRYLDMVNNVPHVGHQHPRVVAAAQAQTAVLNTNTRYLHKNIVEFAEALVRKLPPPLQVCYFVNSGSEANELALRMAKTYRDRQHMIAVEVGYHGNTNAVIDVSSYKFDGKGGKGAPSTTQLVPIPDVYRGKYHGQDNAGLLYAKHIEQAVENIHSQGQEVACFIHESILSCGGQIVLPDGYLKTAYAAVRAAGGLCIADEVQVGFGRVGAHFWGFELQGVIPDIVTMGKPIGNGHPLGAVVTTREVAEAFANGMEYFNTFGGNPVSCAIGKTVLQVIEEEGLQQNALEMGNYLLYRLREIQRRFPVIGDVRGHGLFLGIELVDPQKEVDGVPAPAAARTSYLANRMRELGVLMSTDGPFYNVLKLKPPICFRRQDAEFFLSTFERVLREDFMQIG